MPHYAIIILCCILGLALCFAFGYVGEVTARRHDYPFRVGFIVGFFFWVWGLNTLNRLRAMNYPVESLSDVWGAMLGSPQYLEYRQMDKADRQERRHSRR
jgi:hypothetical protein